MFVVKVSGSWGSCYADKNNKPTYKIEKAKKFLTRQDAATYIMHNPTTPYHYTPDGHIPLPLYSKKLSTISRELSTSYPQVIHRLIHKLSTSYPPSYPHFSGHLSTSFPQVFHNFWGDR